MSALRNKGSVIIIVLMIMGLILMGAVIFLLVVSDQEADKMYQKMLDDADEERKDPKYGYGAIPDTSIIKDPEVYDDGVKPKPIIYVKPVLKKKK